jgi:hypothetical protein
MEDTIDNSIAIGMDPADGFTGMNAIMALARIVTDRKRPMEERRAAFKNLAAFRTDRNHLSAKTTQ